MIYIIVTASIDNGKSRLCVINPEHRKKRYMESIGALLSLVKDDNIIRVVVVENGGNRKTYLDDLGCDVVYTDNNKYDYTFKHYGVNELMDIKEVIHRYNIHDNDTIIKLTGRYKLLDRSFINLVQENRDNYDAFIKFFNVCTLEYMHNDCVLGLLAVKSKYLKDFNYNLLKSPEVEFATYVRENVEKIMEVQQLNLECCFAADLRILVV